MVSKISKNRILDKVKFRRFVRPTNYTIITLFISVYLLTNLNIALNEGINITYISIGLNILISISYYLGYYYPRNSNKRTIFLLASSIIILINLWLVSLTAIIEVEIEGIGTIIIDSRPLFVAPIILLTLIVFKKVIDLFDSWNNTR
jgi:hypothetical protein